MLKNLLIVLLILAGIIAGCGYYVYANRAAIADKVISYAMSSLTGDVKGANGDNAGWTDVLVNAGMKSLQNSVQSNNSNKNAKSSGNLQRDGLATMADMFANATNGNSDDLSQMAQVLLHGFSGAIGAGAAQNSSPQYANNDINARDNKGRTLLMNVCRVDVSPRVIKMILKYGADINAVDENGRTALMYAAALNQNHEVLLSLLNKGADVNIKDNEGNTVINYAPTDELRNVIMSYEH